MAMAVRPEKTLAGVTDNLTPNDLQQLREIALQNQEDISSLQSDVEECFISVSNGKTRLASAITDKGVVTDSDATFEQMAENIESMPTPCQVISLGSGTTFDLKALVPDVDYTALTLNNFIIANLPPTIGPISATEYGKPNEYTGTGTAAVTRSLSYNSATGILTAYSVLSVQGTVSDSPYSSPGTNSSTIASSPFLVLGR